MFFEINNQSKIKIRKSLIRELVSRTAKVLNVPAKKKISVAMVSGQSIRKINKKYRHQDKATSILSFSAGNKHFFSPKSEVNLLGEIIMAPDVIRKRAAKKKTGFNKEFSLIFVHGLLHLLGYTHRTEKEAEKMTNLENEITRRIKKLHSLCPLSILEV